MNDHFCVNRGSLPLARTSWVLMPGVTGPAPRDGRVVHSRAATHNGHGPVDGSVDPAWQLDPVAFRLVLGTLLTTHAAAGPLSAPESAVMVRVPSAQGTFNPAAFSVQ